MDPLEQLHFASAEEDLNEMHVDADPNADLVDDGGMLALGQEFAAALQSEMEASKRVSRVRRAQSQPIGWRLREESSWHSKGVRSQALSWACSPLALWAPMLRYSTNLEPSDS